MAVGRADGETVFKHHRLTYGLTLLGLAVMAMLLTGCRQQQAYPNRPILLICPWAQGGGTDRVSRTVAAHLETELGVPVNVINATGGKGVTGHNRGLTARPDGYTIAMTTLELNMMHWAGLTDLTIADCIPLMSLNEDYAALLVRADAPWQTLREMEAAVRQSPGQLKASGTTTGGAWHLALAGWLIEAGLPADAVVWISSTGSAPSLQELISGGLDMVCCSLPEANSLLEAGEVRAIGVMAPQRVNGYEDVPTFTEQGTVWSLGGWRALAIPLDTPPAVKAKLVSAIERMVTGQTKVGDTSFPQFMQQSGFDHSYRAGDELQAFLTESDQKFGKLLNSESMRSVNQDPFPAMTFPSILLFLMTLVLSAIGVQALRRSAPPPPELPARTNPRNYVGFALILTSALIYVLLAETVGFVLLSSLILFVLSLWMGARLRWALGLAILFPVTIYQLFAHGLRVPLPQGWLGW